MDDVDTFLEHFGVRGMKWGVRKKAGGVDTAQATKAPKELSDETAAARKTKEKIQTKGLGSLSNAELRAYNERLNLEQNYKSMNQKTSSTGKQMANKILNTAANQVVSQLTSVIVKNLITNPADAQLKKLTGLAKDTKIPGS